MLLSSCSVSASVRREKVGLVTMLGACMPCCAATPVRKASPVSSIAEWIVDCGIMLLGTLPTRRLRAVNFLRTLCLRMTLGVLACLATFDSDCCPSLNLML